MLGSERLRFWWKCSNFTVEELKLQQCDFFFLKSGSTWLIIICLISAQKDALSFFADFISTIGFLWTSYTRLIIVMCGSIAMSVSRLQRCWLELPGGKVWTSVPFNLRSALISPLFMIVCTFQLFLLSFVGEKKVNGAISDNVTRNSLSSN